MQFTGFPVDFPMKAFSGEPRQVMAKATEKDRAGNAPVGPTIEDGIPW